MSKTTVSASATGLPSRRLLLATGPAAAVFMSLRETPAEGSTLHPMRLDQTQDDLAISLWEARSALRPLFIEASRVQDGAYSRLPNWAKAGPAYLGHDGSLSGPIVGWPAIQDMQPSDHPGGFRLVRSGKSDIEREMLVLRNFRSEEQCSAIAKERRSELAKRLRAKRAEQRRAGVLAANWAYEALCQRLYAIEDEINALQNTTPNAAAIHIIMTVIENVKVGERIDESVEIAIALPALEFLRPHLRGLVKVHVDEWLNNRDTRIDSTQAYVYGNGEGADELT